MTTDTQVPALNKLKTGADLKNKLQSLQRGRKNLDAQWKLNLAFYKGQQYTYYNKALRRLDSLPVEDGERPRYRVRLINNQIVTGAHSLLARLTKTKPAIMATPNTGSDVDLRAAQVAESLLEHWWDVFNLDDKLSEALLWAIITGQGYWKITWDNQAGSSMKFTLDPQGQPITDDTLVELYNAELAQMGIPPQEQVVYMGDIRVEVVSPFDVYLDDSAKTFDECKYMVCVHYMAPEEVKERWNIDVLPDAVTTSQDTVLPYKADKAQEPSLKAVNIGYFLPTPLIPNGRYVVWVDEKIVEDIDWPYPIEMLPLIKFPGVRVPGRVYDGSPVEQAIPIQKDLNKTLSQIIEYKNLTLKPRVWAPTGSLNGVRLTSEPGAVYEFNPIDGMKPEVEQLPSLPPYVFEHLANIRDSLKEVFGINEITEGTPPPNVEAGIAIDPLQEMATDRLAPTILLIERSLARAGEIMLCYAQKYYVEPRSLRITGGGAEKVQKFNKADIAGGVNIHVDTGSALPRTRAGRQARIFDYVDRGILRPDQAAKYLDIADLEGLKKKFQLDDDMAYREHDRLIKGQPLNANSMQNAIQQAQSGQAVDPNTGQPFTDPNAMKSWVHDQSLAPFPFEDYQTHMDIHAQFMKSPAFDQLPPNVQSDFLSHWQQTLQTWMSLPKPVEYKPVSPTLQLKGTLGPTAAADILNKAGVYDISPDTMRELPLETWISDKAESPNEQNEGNSPVDQQQMAQAQAEHENAQQQQAELHGHKAREAAAKADLAQKRANAPIGGK